MDIEFLDLIRTFEKTLKRIEVLDEKVTSFKDILETLRGNLDELVELVMLEGIVDLAQDSTQKINRLNQECDALIKAYEAIDKIKESKEKERLHVEKMEHTLSELQHMILSMKQTTNISHNLPSSFIETEEGLYYIKERQVCFYSKETLETQDLIEGMSLLQSNDLILVQQLQEIVIMKDQTIISTLAIQCDTYWVRGYQLYFLFEGQLKVMHLLTHQIDVIETDVLNAQPVADGIWIQTSTQLKKELN